MSRRRPRRLALAVTLTAVLSLSGCAAGGSSDANSAAGEASGTTLSFHSGDPTSLLPQKDIGSQIAMATCANLVEINTDTQEFEPLAAESVESEDSQHWTITLREGWTFQDGTPVTSASFVKAWNEGAYGPNAWQANGFFTTVKGYDEMNPTDGSEPTADTLSGVKAVDERTITVDLKTPNADFPKILSTNGTCPLPEAYFEDPEAYEQEPISNGPYRVTEWVPNQHVRLQKWDDFRGADGFSGQADTLEAKMYTSVDSAYTDLAAGNLDMIRNVPAAMVSRAQQELPESALYATSIQSKQNSFQIPSYVESLKDPRIRKAFSLSIDRESIAASLLRGNAEPADSLVPPSIDSYREGACEACTFDPEQARQLLEEAGGLDTPLVITYVGERDGQLVQALARQIEENLGIQVRLDPRPYSQISEMSNKKTLEGMVFNLWGWTYKSPDQYLGQFESSGDGNNLTRYSNPEVDQALGEARALADEDERAEAFAQIERRVLEDQPTIPVFIPTDYGLASDKVKLNDVQGDIQYYRADLNG